MKLVRGRLVGASTSARAGERQEGPSCPGTGNDALESGIGGLDRLHRSRGILGCYDFSATPFTPSGKKSTGRGILLPEEELDLSLERAEDRDDDILMR